MTAQTTLSVPATPAARSARCAVPTLQPGLLPALISALLLAFSPNSYAEDNHAENSAPAALALNGFGTLGLARSSERGADYVFDNLQPKGTGRSHEWANDVDSRLGLQLTANLSPSLSAVLQVVSEYRWDGTYTPMVNWANLRYAVTPALSVRVGRIALDSFMASDSRKIGYSNLTARPPTEVYRLLALRDSDGIDATYRYSGEEFVNTFTVLYGKRTVTNTRAINVHSTDVAGLFERFEHGPLTLHAAYQQRRVDNQNPPLGKFMSLGASYDPGPWFASAEWVKAINYNASKLKITRAAWYLNTGVRLGDFSPYVTVAALCPLSETGVAPVGQHSYSSGVRWDVRRNIDIKFQWDHIRLNDNSFGTLQNIAPGTRPGGHFNVISLLTDFVF